MVRHLPFTPGVSTGFSSLAVYHGTFLTAQNGTFIAFGAAPNDQVRLRAASGVTLGNSTEYPSTGLPRGWETYTYPGGAVGTVIHENNPVTGTSSLLTGNSVIFPRTWYPCGDFKPNTVCYNNVLNSSFAGNNTSYFVHSCDRCDYLTSSFTLLIRADLQSGTWVKTQDVPGLFGPFAADPVSDGILWASSTINSFGGLTKVNINTSPFTYTWYYPTQIGNTAPFVGMAFGPPVADIVSPKNVPPLSGFKSKPWTPIEMLLKRHP